MIASLAPIGSLLAGIFIMMSGCGFLSTLVSLRLQAASVPPELIGLVGTAYFAGLTLGAVRAGRVVRRVGHIRAFTAFVSVLSAAILACALHQQPVLWAALRFVQGVSMAGVFVCVESWLNDRAEGARRGSVLAGYMICLYAGQAISQYLLTLDRVAPAMPFMAASILATLAVLPVTLTRMAGPPVTEAPALPVSHLYRISPLGIAGVWANGLILGAFYALSAVYLRRLGFRPPEIALFMSVVILGGIVLQWPLGRLSDRYDRRAVIIGVFAGTLAVSLALALVHGRGAALTGLGALFGGLSFSLYPLCVGHANDRLSPGERVGASGGLVLVYSIGAAMGPLPAAAAMTAMGTGGLFLFIAACAACALGFALWRQHRSLPVPGALQQPYQILPRTTPVSAALDPRAPQIEREAAYRTDASQDQGPPSPEPVAEAKVLG